MEAVVREFWLQAGLKGDIVGYGLELGYLFFQFKEARKRDAILHQPWVVAGQALAMEPWWLGFFIVGGHWHGPGVGSSSMVVGGAFRGGDDPKHST